MLLNPLIDLLLYLRKTGKMSMWNCTSFQQPYGFRQKFWKLLFFIPSLPESFSAWMARRLESDRALWKHINIGPTFRVCQDVCQDLLMDSFDTLILRGVNGATRHEKLHEGNQECANFKHSKYIQWKKDKNTN